MWPFNKWLNLSLSLVLCYLVVLSSSQNPVERFEYKYSFKPPYLAQKDGSVPFWEYGGNCIASLENVRVAPSLRSQKGAIWTKQTTNFEWWNVDIVFRVTGRGRIGADGLAFWYTSEKGSYDGEVFGSSDRWKGLGLFFDSFDNDNNHNNPYIMAVVNDGNMAFDHQNDGASQSLAGCLRDFRNKPYPTRARIQYYMNTLTVWFHNGMTNNEQDIEVCLRVENIYLPKEGYFGVSAATGGLADDHDILHFLTSSLLPPGAKQQEQVNQEDQKVAQEYAQYEKKLEEQKQQYQKDHPDAHPNEEEWYESENQRELRQIFQGQSQLAEWTKAIATGLDALQQKQDRILAVVSQGGGIPHQVPGQPMPMINNDALLASQNSLLSTVQELRNYVIEINQKAENIQRTTGKATPVGYDQISMMNEVRDGLSHLKQAALVRPDCPAPTPCISVTLFVTFAVLQTLVVVAYMVYRDKRESSLKKFY